MKTNSSNIIGKVQTQIFIVYILLIFEGALRKWIFPQLSSALFFIKDPFILYIYYLCWRYKLFPTNRVAVVSYYLSLFFLVFGFVQTLISPFPFAVVVYGWRSYFMYMPLIFIMEKYCDIQFLKKIAAFTCYVAIPMAVLTYQQYKSPPDAFINRNVGESKTEVFTVGRGVVRTSGTFSFFTGQAFFIASVLSMLLFNYFLGKKQSFLPEIVSYVAAMAFLSNLAVSGSRSSYAACAIIVIFLIFSSLLLINKKKSASIISFAIVGVFLSVVMFNTVFSEQLELITERNTNANEGEGSPIDRILGSFIFSADEDIPYLGHGLGVGSIGGAFLITGTSSFALAESEWARIQLENGYFIGFLYIMFKLYLAYYILKNALFATLASGSPIPLIMVGFIFPTILIGQMTMNGITMGFGWIFLGYSMAVNKVFLYKEHVLESIPIVIAT